MHGTSEAPHPNRPGHWRHAPREPALTADKAELRARIRSQRSASAQALAPAFAEAVHGVLASQAWLEAGTVALYLALPGEPDLTPLIADAWRRRVTVLLPRVVARDEPLEFAIYNEQTPLCSGPLRTRHPAGPATDPARIDWIAVPGLAADIHGYRLGYGGGYYDRTLPRAPRARRVWIGARAFVLPQVPADPWDVPVHALATEEGLVGVADGASLKYCRVSNP